MTAQPYKPFEAETIGTTKSCYTLERMLNAYKDNGLTRKTTSNIARYFTEVRKISLAIHDPEIRKIVGKMMLKHVKHFPIDTTVPEEIEYVIRNVKYAYIKDMMINDVPLNYERRLNKREIEEYYAMAEGEEE